MNGKPKTLWASVTVSETVFQRNYLVWGSCWWSTRCTRRLYVVRGLNIGSLHSLLNTRCVISASRWSLNVNNENKRCRLMISWSSVGSWELLSSDGNLSDVAEMLTDTVVIKFTVRWVMSRSCFLAVWCIIWLCPGSESDGGRAPLLPSKWWFWA